MKFKATLSDRGLRVLERGFLPTLEKLGKRCQVGSAALGPPFLPEAVRTCCAAPPLPCTCPGFLIAKSIGLLAHALTLHPATSAAAVPRGRAPDPGGDRHRRPAGHRPPGQRGCWAWGAGGLLPRAGVSVRV